MKKYLFIFLLIPYVMKEVAKERNILCVDCYSQMYEMFKNISEDDSKRYVMNFEPGLYENYPEGSNDDTHFRADGAFLISKIFATTIKESGIDLSKYMK